jgi:hypothetical protein
MKTIGITIEHHIYKISKVKNGIISWLLCILFTFYSPIAFAQLVSSDFKEALRPDAKTKLMCTRDIKLKPGVDPKAFEKWIIEYWNPEWRDWIPGYESYVDKTTSDQEEPQYFYCLKFSSTTRGIHADDYVDWHRELIYYKPTKYLYDELFEFIELDPFFNNKTCREW